MVVLLQTKLYGFIVSEVKLTPRIWEWKQEEEDRGKWCDDEQMPMNRNQMERNGLMKME